MKTKTVQEFINWLDYEQNLSEIYYKWTLKDFQKSTRIFENKLGILLEELAGDLEYKLTTYGRFMAFLNKLEKKK